MPNPREGSPMSDEFDDDAVRAMADAVGSHITGTDGEATQRESNAMMQDIADVCDVHGIETTDRRIDLAVAGAKRHLDRQVATSISDFRQSLEAQARMFGGGPL